jgi:putative lysine transport system permease protein
MFTLLTKMPNDFFGAAFYLADKYASLFLYGIRNTLVIALTSTVIGIFLGLGVGILKAIPNLNDDPLWKKILIRVVKILSGTYVEVFRGTPMMVQAVFIYYSFLDVFKMFPIMGSYRITAGIVIVSINTGAYMAEIIRAGIQSLDKGQNEAARSIGMNNFQTMIFIILPQAIKNAFPAIGNEFVVNIKDTSVLNVVGITELFFQSMTVAGTHYAFQEAMFISAIIYLFLTYTTTTILKIIEKRMDMPISGGPSSSSTPILVTHYKPKESHHAD